MKNERHVNSIKSSWFGMKLTEIFEKNPKSKPLHEQRNNFSVRVPNFPRKYHYSHQPKRKKIHERDTQAHDRSHTEQAKSIAVIVRKESPSQLGFRLYFKEGNGITTTKKKIRKIMRWVDNSAGDMNRMMGGCVYLISDAGFIDFRWCPTRCSRVKRPKQRQRAKSARRQWCDAPLSRPTLKTSQILSSRSLMVSNQKHYCP